MVHFQVSLLTLLHSRQGTANLDLDCQQTWTKKAKSKSLLTLLKEWEKGWPNNKKHLCQHPPYSIQTSMGNTECVDFSLCGGENGSWSSTPCPEQEKGAQVLMPGQFSCQCLQGPVGSGASSLPVNNRKEEAVGGNSVTTRLKGEMSKPTRRDFNTLLSAMDRFTGQKNVLAILSSLYFSYKFRLSLWILPNITLGL